MSYRAMPFVFLNMGGEMIYILEQRLQAQQVGDDKAQRVLADIMGTMFNRPCLQLLFEPQPLYPRSVLRHYFEQIAHSSVMRLNETSMDKLFDLMSKAVKYQVLLCKEPSELVLVTMNHLDGVKQIFTSKSEILSSIDYAQSLLMDNFVETPLWEMAAIRSELMNYFAGQRIKISLMLREGRQLEDGRFVLFAPNQPIELPYNCCVPGTVRYIGKLGEVIRMENFPVEETYNTSSTNEVAPFFRDRATSRGTTLGQNMYSGKRGAVTPTPLATEDGSRSSGHPKPVGNELQLLEMLLKGPAKAKAKDGHKEPTFSLTLFEDDGNEGTGGVTATNETAKPDSAGTGKGVKPRSAQTRLSKKLRESMKLDGGDEARPTSKDAKNSEESTAGTGKKKATRGEQMLEMIDAEVKKGERPASRPKSRGKSPAATGPGTNAATGNKVPMRNSLVSRVGGRPATGSSTANGK